MKKVQFTAIFLLSFILFGLISERIVSRTDYPNSDFFSFWLAGRLILSHQNPYLANEWINGHHLFGADWISDPTFLYPLPLAFIFLPFGLLNIYQATVFWVWISQVMLLIVVLLLLPLFGVDGKHYILPIVTGIILFRPIVSLLLYGQIGAFLLLTVVVASIMWDKKRWIWGGIIISLSVLKPNIGIPMLALISVYLFFRKYYQGFIGMLLAFIMMAVMACVYNPNWIWEYFEVLKSKQAQTFGYTPTIWGLAAFVSQFNLSTTLLTGSFITLPLLVMYIIIVTKLKGITPLEAVSFSVIIALLITPYLWPYDQIILVFPIVVIMATVRKVTNLYLRSALVFLIVDIVGFLLYWISIKIQMENLNSILSLLVLGIYALILFQYRTFSNDQPALTPDAASPAFQQAAESQAVKSADIESRHRESNA